MNMEHGSKDKNSDLINNNQFFAIIIVIIHFSTVFGVIYNSTSYFPFQDSWVIANFYIKFKTSGLDIRDFFISHNEHRQPIPLLLIYLNFVTLNWSPFVNLVSNIFLLSLSYLIIVKLYMKNLLIKENKFDCFLNIFIISLIIFNFGQWLNYVWEWQITWFVFIFFSSCFMFSIQRYVDVRSNTSLLLMIASALFASGSTAAGFMLWPAGILSLFIIKAKKNHTITWSLISIILIYIYILNRPPTEIKPDNFPFIESTLEYTFRLIASPAGEAFWYGLFVVFCGSYALIVLLVRRQHESMIGWIAIFLTVGAAALFAGITRGPWLGPTEGSSSRYATLASLFIVSSYIMTLQIVRQRIAQFAVILLYVVPIAIHLGSAMKDVAWLNQRIEAGRACLVQQTSNDACIDILYVEGHSEQLKRWWNQLKDIGWPGAAL